MDNLEVILQCLSDFEKAKEKRIGPELDHLLSHIAKTGRTEFPWHLLKPLIAHKLERVLDDFFENSSSTKPYISEPTSKSKDLYPDVQKLISNLNCFTGIPFTIQRLCELITEPKRYYKSTDKFLRGVEKNIMVVSTVQPDGVLITRSVPSVLTNGDISLTKPDTTPISTNPSPLNNTPLNTITQENTPNLAATPKIPTEEKPGTLSSEETCEKADGNTVTAIQDNKSLKLENVENTKLQITENMKPEDTENSNIQLTASEDVHSSENNGKIISPIATECSENCIENTAKERMNGTCENTHETHEKIVKELEKMDEDKEMSKEEKSKSENDKIEEN